MDSMDKAVIRKNSIRTEHLCNQLLSKPGTKLRLEAIQNVTMLHRAEKVAARVFAEHSHMLVHLKCRHIDSRSSEHLYYRAAPPGITGITSAEGCSVSCRIVFVAETNSRLVACSAPVFKLRSNRGKLLLETSSRMMCPFLKTLLVAHRSTVIL